MKANYLISFLVLVMSQGAKSQCPSSVTISGVYSVPYAGSHTWIASNGITTIQSGPSLVELDANPLTDGYVLLDVGFEAEYGSTFSAVVVTPCDLLSLDDLSVEMNMDVFPNPTTGEVHIQLFNENIADINIEITNQLGQKILQLDDQMFIDKKLTVNLSEFNAGMYFITTKIGQYTSVKRLIKL